MQLGATFLDTAALTGVTKPTSFPASIVAFSFFPSSEPEATMALSMSPVAKWQTQKFSANLGACGGKDKNQEGVNTVSPENEPGPYWLCELSQMSTSLVVTGMHRTLFYNVKQLQGYCKNRMNT